MIQSAVLNVGTAGAGSSDGGYVATGSSNRRGVRSARATASSRSVSRPRRGLVRMSSGAGVISHVAQ